MSLPPSRTCTCKAWSSVKIFAAAHKKHSSPPSFTRWQHLLTTERCTRSTHGVLRLTSTNLSCRPPARSIFNILPLAYMTTSIRPLHHQSQNSCTCAPWLVVFFRRGEWVSKRWACQNLRMCCSEHWKRALHPKRQARTYNDLKPKLGEGVRMSYCVRDTRWTWTCVVTAFTGFASLTR